MRAVRAIATLTLALVAGVGWPLVIVALIVDATGG